VVEEERPGERPELRAFLSRNGSARRPQRARDAYTNGLTALGFGAVGRPRVTPLEDTGWADACVSTSDRSSSGGGSS